MTRAGTRNMCFFFTWPKVRNCNLMASCGFAHLSGDRVDQVETIPQMSSVWLWEAVQRVLKATFEIFCI